MTFRGKGLEQKVNSPKKGPKLYKIVQFWPSEGCPRVNAPKKSKKKPIFAKKNRFFGKNRRLERVDPVQR